MLQARLEGLQAALAAKDEILRLKDEQLRQAEQREVFYQDELKAVRLLAAPEEKKRRKWLGIF